MRQAVITGASGMIGSAIRDELIASGAWSVFSPSRRELDVRDPERVHQVLKGAPCELLVCAAGVINDGPLLGMSSAVIDELWGTNYLGAKHCANAVLPGMIERRMGHVVFLSSQSAVDPPAGQAIYAAAKAALLGLTRDLAKLAGPSGVRINAILPGFIESRMTDSVTGARRDMVRQAHALGRFNTPRQVAEFVRFLHERLPHTSGQVFHLDSR
jgi:3-oxoacyl-[acyl-carrier protein] reductase